MRTVHSFSLAMSALGLAALVPWFASCAASEADQGDRAAEPPAPLPGAAVAEAGDAADGGVADAVDASSAACDPSGWCPVPTPVSTLYSLTSVWGSGKNDVWAVGSGGTIIHHDGTKWTVTPTTVRNTFHAVGGTGPNDVWAVSMTDVMLHTTGFAGGSAVWQQVVAAQAEPKDAFPRATLALWAAAGGALRIGARDRTVYDPLTGGYPTFNQYTLSSADGGVAWSRVEGAGTVHGFWGSANDLWYVADNSERNGWQKGVTMHGIGAADGGVMQWSSVDSQSSVTLEAIWGSSASDIWAVGDMGVIRHMVAGALRWAIVPSPTAEALHAIWGSSASDIWAVGDLGTILHFDGSAWTKAKGTSVQRHLYGVWGSAANDVWIVGDGISLHYTGPKPAAEGGGQ